ncbi:MAG: hypothetical protein WC260_02105 [Candidatus Pacearchaeota archaeon]
MVLKKITYLNKNKKINLIVKPVSNFSTGLMFKRSTPPLLFNLKKEKFFSITALFCKDFLAITLDKNYKLIKSQKVKAGTLKTKLYGQYLIEIIQNYDD